MSAASVESVRCELGGSRSLTLWWLLVYGGAMVIVFLTPLFWGWRVLLVMVLTVALADALWRIAWRRGRFAIAAIHIDSEGSIELQRGRNGQWLLVEWQAPTVFAVVVLMRWRPAGQYRWRRLVIPADAIDPDCFRRARVALRRLPRPG